ncbi:hypothetical protein [Roseobacter denitrificans]|uniref:hypothetical protein n=1 Tax=Roseobacter denitrificans TaxID=2434 RepID=UPI00031F778E|nr:hypothetical protein [Roseobacter denitrificans]SFG03788.1 hypothetical protein SAMN05443635_10675 [Roseobacter denitrificans OCh 114]
MTAPSDSGALYVAPVLTQMLEVHPDLSVDLKEGRVEELRAKARFEGFPIHAIWSPTPFQPAASREFIALMAKTLSDEGVR